MGGKAVSHTEGAWRGVFVGPPATDSAADVLPDVIADRGSLIKPGPLVVAPVAESVALAPPDPGCCGVHGFHMVVHAEVLLDAGLVTGLPVGSAIVVLHADVRIEQGRHLDGQRILPG